MEIFKVIISSITSIAESIAHILPFTSKFGIIKYICEQGIIFGISWIDKSLFFVANILSIAIVFVIGSKTNMNAKAKTGLSILVYLVVLSLLAEKIFWFILLCVISLAAIVAVIYFIKYAIQSHIK